MQENPTGVGETKELMDIDGWAGQKYESRSKSHDTRLLPSGGKLGLRRYLMVI
jgi:hypothetical protein